MRSLTVEKITKNSITDMFKYLKKNKEDESPDVTSPGYLNKDFVVKNYVEKLWDTYDEDGDGVLDKAETRNFLADTALINLDAQGNFQEEFFNTMFEEFD